MKKLLTTLAALLIAAPAAGADFTDVHEGDWYYPYVQEAADYFGLFNGYPDGTFRPNNNITRAEVVTVLTRLFELDVTPCYGSPYPDVPVDAWYCPYVKAVKFAGISDTPDGENFRPDDPAQRFEVIVMLENGLSTDIGGSPLPDTCQESPFEDVLPEDDFCSAVERAKQQGVTTGYPDGTFRPFSHITRAEIATMMDRVGERQLALENALALDVAAYPWYRAMVSMYGKVTQPQYNMFACDNY